MSAIMKVRVSELFYAGMVLSVETWGPDEAREALKKNSANRAIRKPYVERYARDMLRGAWRQKPIAICFTPDGFLGNGQHTLSAIEKSGVPQQLLIARNVPKESIAVLDTGLARTVNDVARFLDAHTDSRRASIARVIKYGPSDRSARSFDELFSAFQEHESAIESVLKHAPNKKKGFNVVSLGVCARALYTEDECRITRFLSILKTGEIDGAHENAALRLRDFLLMAGSGSNYQIRVEQYQKTQSALRNFIDGKPMSKLYGTQAEMFPVPE